MTDESFLARMTHPLAPHPDERIVEAPRGSVLVFGVCLIHAGRTNGDHKPRRSILSQFVPTGVRARFDWSALPLEIRQQLKPESLKLLGLTVAAHGAES